MASGNVKSIALDITHRKLYYEIEDGSDCDLVSDEDLVCFGAGCPVSVLNPSSTSTDDEGLDGQILHGEKVNEKVIYTVMILLDKKGFVVETNVPQERINFVQVDKQDGLMNDGIQPFSGSAAIPSVLELKDNEDISSCTLAKPAVSTVLRHDSASQSSDSFGQKRSLAQVADDGKKKSKLLKDISNNQSDGFRSEGGTVGTKKCPQGFQYKEAKKFRIEIPPTLLQTSQSQKDVYGKFRVVGMHF